MELIEELQRIELETNLLLTKEVNGDDFVKINRNINYLIDTCHQLQDSPHKNTKAYKDLIEGIKFLEDEEFKYKMLLCKELKNKKEGK